MKIKEIMYHRFTLLNDYYSVYKSLDLMEQKRYDYGVVQKEGKIVGYITGEKLKNVANKDEPVTAFLQPFSKEVQWDVNVEELGELQDTVILIYGELGDYKGILDSEALLQTVKNLYQSNKDLVRELDTIVNFSSDEIYVTDGSGKTIMVNKAFEENSGVPREAVLGKNVEELENEGVFRPSVTKLVLEQKKQVSVIQEYSNKTKVLVTGTPVFNEDGSIYRVIINARDTAKLNKLKAQLEEIENLKDLYYQELINFRKDCLRTDGLVAQSHEMIQILNMARKIAEVDSTVLLTGETGVGKGLLARYIHDNSVRNHNSFIAINCGAIPENLLESELFGYDPGAFTGALRKGKIGKIELANHGTLFLDEIGDLPLPLQVKLLDVIEKGVITRIGGTREIRLDIRFITATNQELSLMVKKGDFRKDLYFRLNVLPLEIPPLRKRKEDIAPLAKKFLEKFKQKYRKEKEIDSITLNFLQNYSWPGNVRELENLMERLVIVINEESIKSFHLPEYIKIENISTNNNLTKELLCDIAPLEKIKEDIEKKILDKLYEQYRNTYKIAQILKVNQSTVVRKLNKYNIKLKI
ncbi:MAG: PAS domain-containing protein [Dethiobacter sp.]|nr:MAG: PAS domain-containing protein [Dethiobacter sp.]